MNARVRWNKWPLLVLLVAAVSVLLFLLVGCSSSTTTTTSGATSQPTATSPSSTAPASAPVSDTVRVVVGGEPSSLDPMGTNDDGNARNVINNVNDYVLDRDPKTLEAVPALAEKLPEIVDDTHYKLTIRQGVKFSDGSPLTAEDVAYSINRMVDPAQKAGLAGFFESIDKAEATDANTVTVTTKVPDPIFNRRMTLMPVVSKAYITGNTPEAVSVMPLGSGPYKMVEWQRGVSITLAPNPNYWGTKPAIANAVFKFYEEAATRAALMKNGEADVALTILPEYIKDLPAVKETEGLEIGVIKLNLIRGPMTNKDLRWAAALSIDRDSLVKDLYLGHGFVADGGSIMKPSYFGYNPNTTHYPYDPAKAKEYLAKAGYKGEPVQFVVEGGRWLKDRELSEAIISYMQAVGFNVQEKVVSWQEWLTIYFDKEKVSPLIMAFQSNDIADAARTTFDLYSNEGHGNVPPTYDAKLRELAGTLDQAARLKGYQEMFQIAYDEVLAIPLIGVNDIYGVNPKLVWEPRSDGKLILSEMSYGQ